MEKKVETINSACGVDLGSLQFKISGCTTQKGVEMICNEISKRETPNLVGITNAKRALGQAAFAQLKRNYKNTVQFAQRVLGARLNDPHVELEKKWFYQPLVGGDDGKLRFKLRVRGGPMYELLPEQVVAMMLQNVKTQIKANKMNCKDLVLTVPGFFTEQERNSLLDACKIAEIKCLKIMNETSATALEYGILRRKELDLEKDRLVLFIDMGYSKTSICLGALKRKEGKILQEFHERCLGVRDLDWIMYKYYCDMLQKQVQDDEDITLNKKVRLRLLQSIEKQRMKLSSLEEASVNQECLWMDADLYHNLTREDWLKLVNPVFQRFQTLCAKAQTYIQKNNLKLHSIEIVGGGTRIPKIRELIEKVFKMKYCTTQKPTECVARGAGIQSAILNSNFRVADYKMTEINIYPLKCSWKFLDPQTNEVIEDPKKSPALFTRKTTFPQLKSINFPKDCSIDVSIYYDPVPLGAQREVAHYLIHRQVPEHDDFKTKLKVRLNANRIVEFDSAELIQVYQEEVEVVVKTDVKKDDKKADDKKADDKKMDEEKPKDQKMEEEKPKDAKPSDAKKDDKKIVEEKKVEQKVEKQMKKRTKYTKLKVDNLVNHRMNEKTFEAFFELEAQLHNKDVLIEETHFFKNELESRVYDYREKLSSYWSKHCKANQEKNLETILQDQETWLYDEGMDAKKKDYQARLKLIDENFKDLIDRSVQFVQIPQRLQTFSNVLTEYQKFCESKEEKYNHITVEERNEVAGRVMKAKQFISEVDLKTKQAKLDCLPPVVVKSIDDYWTKFIEDNKAIVNKPVPKPEPVVVPEPEKKEGEGEGEVKGEQNGEENKKEGNSEDKNNNEQEEKVKEGNKMDVEEPKVDQNKIDEEKTA